MNSIFSFCERPATSARNRHRTAGWRHIATRRSLGLARDSRGGSIGGYDAS